MPSPSSRRIGTWCLLLASGAPAVAPAQRGSVAAEPAPRTLTVGTRLPAGAPTFEDVISLQRAGNPMISPDGRSIAYEVTSTDWEHNRYDTEIWLARAGEAPFQLTRTERESSTSPRWSPDGRWIAFLADRGDGRQVQLIRAAGGEAVPLTSVKGGVGTFQWAPDGTHIAFTATEPESETMRVRQRRYGDFVVVDAEYRPTHLWVVDVPPSVLAGTPGCGATADIGADTDSAGRDPLARRRATRDTAGSGDAARGNDLAGVMRPRCIARPAPRRLTGGTAFTVGAFEWSPDGRRIAFDHRPDPNITSAANSDISVLDVATGVIRPIVRRPGSDSDPHWSPDGRWIAFSTADGDTSAFYYRNSRLARVASDGGVVTVLTGAFDEDPRAVAWVRDGIRFLARRGVTSTLYTLDPESHAIRVVSDPRSSITSADFTADGRTLAVIAESGTQYPEVYRVTATPWHATAVSDLSRQIQGWPLGTREVIRWRSSDGVEIEGVLLKPVGYDSSRRYPLLVDIHGGPTGISVPQLVSGTYLYPHLQWLAKGAVILLPNYRGSAGYGEAFRSLNVRNLGLGDAWDVLSGVDYLVRRGIADSTRMGVMGWSQGGYISAFLATTTTRFRAISVGAGISDWMTYYVNTDIHPFTRQYLRATPWTDPDIYARTSPITYIRQARTPTQIQHGELDRRVPIANAYELFQGLKDVGVPTRLIVYKGFGHGITKPRERLAATWHNWQWFARYIWGEEVEPPLEVPGRAAGTESGRNDE